MPNVKMRSVIILGDGMQSIVMLNVIMLCAFIPGECYADNQMLSVIIVSVVLLNVFMLDGSLNDLKTPMTTTYFTM